MADRWVVNASPLIALGSIGQLILLTRLGRRVLVPKAVLDEVVRGGDEASRAVRAAEEIQVVEDIEPHPSVSMWGPGPG